MWSQIQQYKKTIVTILIVLAVAGFLTYSYTSKTGIFSDLQNDLKLVDTDVPFSYTDLDGNSIDLEQFKGKPLIINAWATWIPFSQTELVLMNEIQKKYGDTITVIAMNRMENIEVIKSYLSVFQIPRDILFIADTTDHFYKVVGGYAMPETLFYTSDGVLTMHTRGVLTEAELATYTEAIIEK